MTRHIEACWKRLASTAPAQSGKSAPRWFHLVIQGQYASNYWLHLQAPSNSTFGNLDSLLRRLWLECCDHLSEFKFPAKAAPRGRVTSGDIGAIMAALRQESLDWMSEGDDTGDTLMEQALGSRLQPGVEFFHEYDFGSTTSLALRVAGEHAAPAMEGGLKLLARNDPPELHCSACGKPATQLCLDCGGEWCDACAESHECGSEMLVPVINSPRTGVCGYSGPSVEP